MLFLSGSINMSSHVTIGKRRPGRRRASLRCAAWRTRRSCRSSRFESSMPLPIRHLPVLQKWDCQVCGSCCKEYPVTITEEEKKRLEGQGWEKDPSFQHVSLFKKIGPFFRSRY